jgi:predicted  nucleic acid-binding Zn-ribbon protein
VKGYLADRTANPASVAALKAAWAMRTEWKKLADETARLRSEQQEIERSTEETRDNLRAIEKNKAAEDLRKTLTTRLAKASARLDQVIKRLIQADMQIKELELRFREAVKELKASRPA